MKKKSRKPATVNFARWASYAVAGAATAVAASNDAEAVVYYSGPINTTIGPGGAHNFFTLTTLHSHVRGSPPGPGSDELVQLLTFSGTNDINPAYNVGGKHIKFALNVLGTSKHWAYAYKLGAGANLSAQHFALPVNTLIYFANAIPGSHSHWGKNQTGFLAFEFHYNSQAEQYGWARITTSGGANFTLVDYAFGSPGQAITAGEEVAPTPEPATLCLFAMGAAGLVAVRRSRKRRAVA